MICSWVIHRDQSILEALEGVTKAFEPFHAYARRYTPAPNSPHIGLVFGVAPNVRICGVCDGA